MRPNWKPSIGTPGGADLRRFWSLFAAALLLGLALAQEVSDAEEVGTPPGLLPPTSPLYADPGWYDLVAARWVEPDATSLWLEIELGAVDVGGFGALGLRQPIIEVYVDDGGGGAATLLPGSGLRMPDGDGWRQAVRVTGDGVWWWEATVDGRGLLPPRPLPAVVDGRVVRIAWPTVRPDDGQLYAITGVHDPFSPDGWRPMATEPSPWAFASDTPGPPVIDVLPGDHAVWRQVRETGALVRPSDPIPAQRGAARWRWWVLMGLGLGLASAGLWWRSRPPAASAEPIPTAGESPPAPLADDAAGEAHDAGAPVVGDAIGPADLGLLITDDELVEPGGSRARVGGAAAPTAIERSVPDAPQPEWPTDTAPSDAAAPSDDAAAPDAGVATDDAAAPDEAMATDEASTSEDATASTRSTDAPSADSRSAKRS